MLAKITLGAGRLPYRSVRFAWGACSQAVRHDLASTCPVRIDARRLAGGWLVLPGAQKSHVKLLVYAIGPRGRDHRKVGPQMLYSFQDCSVRKSQSALGAEKPWHKVGTPSLTTACERVLCPCRARDDVGSYFQPGKNACAARVADESRRVHYTTSRARTWYFRTPAQKWPIGHSKQY